MLSTMPLFTAICDARCWSRERSALWLEGSRYRLDTFGERESQSLMLWLLVTNTCYGSTGNSAANVDWWTGRVMLTRNVRWACTVIVSKSLTLYIPNVTMRTRRPCISCEADRPLWTLGEDTSERLCVLCDSRSHF